MKILYITEDYFNSKVHHKLADSLVKLGVNVDIFNFYRKTKDFKNLSFLYGEETSYKLYSYQNCSNPIRYKYDFKYKIRTKTKVLLDNISIKQYDTIYASTLFSDGALANYLNKRFQKSFIVAVRGTDINLYLKKMIHLWPKGITILNNASLISCITPNISNKLQSWILASFVRKSLKDKISIIPNGIENYWISNQVSIRKDINKEVNYLFVGRFDKNKNVKRLIEAFVKLSEIYPNVKLHLVGGGGYYSKYVARMLECNKNICFHGSIYSEELLLNIYKMCNIFILPSHSETFGLVYIEALSQGLPIIYSRDQALDGFFDLNFGVSINSKDNKSILKSLIETYLNYKNYDLIGSEIESFRWSTIANELKCKIESLCLEN